MLDIQTCLAFDHAILRAYSNDLIADPGPNLTVSGFVRTWVNHNPNPNPHPKAIKGGCAGV